jgi:phage terminase large subunit-like protein
MFISEDEQNRYLLYYYLNKTFIDSGATEEDAEKQTVEIISKNSSNLFGYHGLAWQLGKISLEFFCLYFLQDTFFPKETNAAAPLAEVHREIWHDIESAINGEGNNQVGRILPRGTGKSVFGTFAATIWVHAYDIKTYTLICSDIGSTAQKFIKDIKNTLLENEYMERAFGVLLDDRDKRYICNSNQLELTNKTFIEAISSESPMRGRKYDNCRPDLIILDDYQSEDDVRTEVAREKKWKRYSDDVKYAVQKAVVRDGKVVKQGTVIIALGTLQHKECFYSRLMKQPTWKFKNKKGVLIDDFMNSEGQKINGLDNYFETGLWLEFKTLLFNFKNEDHLEDAKEFYWAHVEEMKFPMLWGEFWDCLDMAMSYYENPSSFKQEVQGDVDSIGEKWFKTVATEKRTEIETHTFVKTMLLVDPASTNGKKSDYSAYLVGSQSDNNLKYARKAELAKINARTDFDKYIDHMIALIKEYPDITHVSIEKNTFNGADANMLENKIKADPSLSNRSIEIINESQRKNKDDKISTIIPFMNKGQIIFAEEDEEFTKQILEFAGQKFSAHDDAPDITSEFANRIENIEVINKVSFLDRKLLGM